MTSIIIVTYNRLDLVKKCLACCPKDCEIIVVDNNSSEKIPNITIANKDNKGFAIGNNQGMKVARGDYFLLLNSDAFLEKDTVKKLVNFAKVHPDAGVVAPKLLNADGSLQPSAGYFTNLWTVFLIMSTIDNWPIFKKFLPSIHIREPQAFSKIRTFNWITGASLLVPKEVFQKTNGFDEKYFMYGEELEWQYRMRRLGYKSYFVPTARVTHLGFSSSSPANGAIKELQSYMAFFKKYKPAWQLPILKLMIIFGSLLRILRGFFQSKHRWMVKA
ncbi:MAG: glycosyltransferase family 2 protein, partial [bacterium]|nr:glycosyltransferase family 2 protein [bacterium]